MVMDPRPTDIRRRILPATILRNARGQALAEIAIVLPLLLMLFVGTLELGFVLYQGHLVRKIAREAGSLLSRQVTLEATSTAMQGAIDAVPHLGGFAGNATLILSVVQEGNAGTSNDGKPIIVRRVTVGSIGGGSILGDPPQSAFGPAPNYPALDPASNTALQTEPLPNGLTIGPADVLFVAEVYLDLREIAGGLWPFTAAFDDPLYANVIF